MDVLDVRTSGSDKSCAVSTSARTCQYWITLLVPSVYYFPCYVISTSPPLFSYSHFCLSSFLSGLFFLCFVVFPTTQSPHFFSLSLSLSLDRSIACMPSLSCLSLSIDRSIDRLPLSLVFFIPLVLVWPCLSKIPDWTDHGPGCSPGPPCPETHFPGQAAAEASARFFLTPILSLRNSLRENGMLFRQFPAVSFTARSLCPETRDSFSWPPKRALAFF
eukprot:COSAG01_NODE_10536_length_2137_cov_9.826300_2_plen_218_part_00